MKKQGRNDIMKNSENHKNEIGDKITIKIFISL